MRIVLLAGLLCASFSVMAFNLGEVYSVSRLGERLHLEIKILTRSGELLEAGCVHLQKPRIEDDLPWLQQGSISVRNEANPALLISSSSKIMEPVLRIGLSVGCGHGIQRDFTVLLAPPAIASETAPRLPVARSVTPTTEPSVTHRSQYVSRPPRVGHSESSLRTARKLTSRSPIQDRLVLSASEEPGEPTLRLANTLTSWQGESNGNERQRILLRMEYRLLKALYAQTLAQLETTEKLRQMETSIGNLQLETQTTAPPSEPTSNVTPSAATETAAEIAPTTTTTPSPTPTPEPAVEVKPATIPPVAVSPTANQPASPEKAKPTYSWWKTFVFLLLVALAIGAWVLSKHYRGRREENRRFSPNAPEPVMDPRRHEEFDDFDEAPVQVTSEISGSLLDSSLQNGKASTLSPAMQTTDLSLSHASIASATIEEHFEVNPVMELAEIMLSFGRVKGAAQALQEFVDSNPEEALQPWIRLMDVYRIAGMRSEFERVAAELNQHFNVEIQIWDEIPPKSREVGEIQAIEPVEPLPIQWPKSNCKASTIEDAEHIADRVVELWPTKECSEFLDQLLRSNRGGLRTGFSLQLVEEILFLIELQTNIEKNETETAKT